MLRQIRLLLGISVFWLALSMLTDGVNTLLLPVQISKLSSESTQATVLGLLTFIGLLMGALIQPVAGALSDRWKPALGRKGFIALGLLFILISLFLFAVFNNLAGILLGYLLIQISASIAQAGQQALLPDLVQEHRRGTASGLKGFMDIAGAMLGFILLGQLLGSNRTLLAIGVIAGTLVGAWLLAVLLTPEDKPEPSTRPASTLSLAQLFRLNLSQQAAFKRLLLARFLFLFGVYAIGRFLLYFVAERLGLASSQAAQQAGLLLGELALITILASPLCGWLADRVGRRPLMAAGSLLGAVGSLLLVWAHSSSQILIFGGLMSLGSAAFGSASWALLADLVPQQESARYFGLANFSTAGPTAAAGLLGPAVDRVEAILPGNGYSFLFVVAALAFLASLLPVGTHLKKIGVKDGNQAKDSTYVTGLDVLHLPAPSAAVEKDQDPPRGTAQL